MSLFVLLAAAVLAPADPAGPAAQQPAADRPADARPNVVVILADDMGWGDLGANNPDSKIPTPHLDELAARGLRLTDAHSPAAWCTPTRYSLLTGRYSRRGRPWDWNERPQIPEGTPTLGSVFADAGYRTAMVGKWHLGFEGPDGKPLSEERTGEHRGGPVDRGFADYFGIPASLDIPPYYFLHHRAAVDPPSRHVADSASPGWSPIQGNFWRAGGSAPAFEHQKVLPAFRDAAVAAVTNPTKMGEPFMLYVTLASPHTPWAVKGDPADYQGGVGLYGQFVHETDAAVGTILAALDEAGMTENTLVVFTSDNGPVWYDEDEAQYGHASAGPYRGMKGDAWEGGHRVPFFVAGPGVAGLGVAGGTSDALTLHTDLLPTLAAACGVDLPAGAAPDGVNQWPVWSGQTSTAPRTEALLEATGERDFVRLDDAEGRWKLIPWRGSGGFSKPKIERPQPGEPVGQLYNLATDPGERDNRYDDRPEKVAALTAALKRLQATSAPAEAN
ncbi:sulfatase family protein [Alienimonas californiensis]|uniref:Choline-sulfatase n=1 Tax=Alienimonas californiensis TaxID=2527989 RepID=A0A517P5B6_9PLAN|nr:arylsulfatase [Alienimonas californiensis]QDT14561.1 Choline-sulfatase [Alienimonas californiensis]